MSAHLVDVREDKRLSIAKELHAELGMKERILMMEGHFKIISNNNEGTTIHASIPFKANSEEILN